MTDDHMPDRTSMPAFERLAIAISSGIVFFMICYWIAQIAGAIHMLRLAYG